MNEDEMIVKPDVPKYRLGQGMHPGQVRDAYGRFGGGSLDKKVRPQPTVVDFSSPPTIENVTHAKAGIPRRDFAEAFERVVLAKVTDEVWGRIFDKAIEQAEKGDKDARKWLSDYFVGPPIQRASLEMQTRVRTLVSEEIVTSRGFVDGEVLSVQDVKEENT